MKNITFFDHMKCMVNNGCTTIEDQKTEVKQEEISIEKVKQDTVSKLNFHLFDIDQVFAN